MTWGAALARAAVIVAYLVVSTVWLPDRLLRTDVLSGASQTTAGLLATILWAVALVIGAWGLRLMQGRRR